MQIDEKMKEEGEKALLEIFKIARDFSQIDEKDASDDFLRGEGIVVLGGILHELLGSLNEQMNTMINALGIYSDDTTGMIRNLDNIALYMHDHQGVKGEKLLKLKKDLGNVLRKYGFGLGLITK